MIGKGRKPGMRVTGDKRISTLANIRVLGSLCFKDFTVYFKERPTKWEG